MIPPREARTSPARLSWIGLALLAAMIVQPSAVVAREQNQNPPRATRMELLYNNVVVTSRTGQVLYGLFIAVEEDALIVKVGSEERHIPRTELTRVALEAPSRRGSLVAGGALLGLYSGFLLLEDDGYMPAHESAFIYLLYGSVCASAGTGLGFLASLIPSSEVAFSFRDEGDASRREWERLRRYAAGAPSARRVHVSFQGGNVLFGPRATYQDIHRDLLEGFDEGYRSGQHVRLLRQVRLTVSVLRPFEAGLAGVWLSEPPYSAAKYESSFSGTWPDYTSQSSGRSLDAHFSSTGVFAVCGARLPRNSARPWNVTAGFGLGAQSIDFGLATIHWELKNSKIITDIKEDFAVRKRALSALIYGEASVVLKGGLALGLAGDIVFGPSQEVPASSALGLAAHKVRFGNSSIGLSLGYHF